MTPRKAAVLAMNLPPGAAVWRSCGFDNAWTLETHLLAHAVDALAGANWQRGGGKGSQPKPLPRPSDERKRAKRTDRAAVMARRFKQRHEAPPVKPAQSRDARGRFT